MRWLAVALALLLGGCATEIGPSEADLKARWESENVVPGDYKRDLLAFLRTYLNDPTHVRAATVSQPFRKVVGPADRYIVCVRYSARDMDGKYGSGKVGAGVFVNGKLDRFIDGVREVRPLCGDAAYSPFPELERLTR